MRATMTPITNSPMPPNREWSTEKMAPPETRATKNSRRSAPRTVSGRFMALNTRFTLRSAAVDMDRLLSLVLARKEPGHEVHCADCHADAEDDAGEHPFGLAFAIREHQAADDDCDQRQPGRDRAGECGLEDVHRVVPRIAAGRLR